MNDGMQKLADKVLQAVQLYCSKEFAARFEVAMADINRRLAELPVKGLDGKDGRDGVDGVGEIGPAGKSAFELAVEAGFVGTPSDWLKSLRGADGIGEKGADGRDGRDADPALIIEALGKAIAALPTPLNGKDGADGRDGVDGKDADVEEILRVLREDLTKAVAELPMPVDGKDGINGKDADVQAIITLLREDIDKAIAELPQPVNGKDGADGKDADTQRVIDLMLAELAKAVDALPKPADGKDGLNGKDADIVPVVELMRAELAKAVEALPRPADGKDADVEAITAKVLREVATLVDEIPLPKDGKDGTDGKDADSEQVREFVRFEVKEAVAALPTPVDGRDGKDGVSPDPEWIEGKIREAAESVIKTIPLVEPEPVDYQRIDQHIDEKVSKTAALLAAAANAAVKPEELKTIVVEAVRALPVGRDGKDGEAGKSVTLDDVKPFISAEVQREVAALPPAPRGEAGRDADPEVVADMVRAAVDALPTPKDGLDGKSVSVEDVRPLLEEMVKAAMPEPVKGEAGRDATPEQIAEVARPIVADLVADAVKALPAAQPGDVNDAVIRQMIDTAVAELPPPATVKGDRGDRGDDGERGEDGRDGKDGGPGRDALQISILPAVDETRVYARATYASHRGGLVQSLRTTDPIAETNGDMIAAGWSFIVRGIDRELEEVSDDGRILRRVTYYSDGSKFEREHKQYVQIYRGVFREDREEEYQRGDTATWAGSTWHCNAPTREKPSESGGNWTLANKRGRDGKDGDRGRDGKDGKSAPAARP